MEEKTPWVILGGCLIIATATVAAIAISTYHKENCYAISKGYTQTSLMGCQGNYWTKQLDK